MRTLVHCSDLHFGRIDPEVVTALINEISNLDPDVVIVSGDLTQRARSYQFRQAGAFLSQIRKPKVIVPGNHDIALFNLIDRFFRPFESYKEWIHEQTYSSYEDDEVSISAANTAHRLTIDAGRLTARDVERVGAQWRELKSEKIKVLVTHHPLDLTLQKQKFAWGRIKRIAGRQVLAHKPDILCSGHLHETSSFIQEGCIQVAAGTATSTRLKKEANSFNLIITEPEQVMIRTKEWDGHSFADFSHSVFEKQNGSWVLSRRQNRLTCRDGVKGTGQKVNSTLKR